MPAMTSARARPRVYHACSFRVARQLPVISVEGHDMGLMEQACVYCGALYFSNEGIKRDRSYTICCMRGKVKLPPLGDPPALLRHLLTGDDDECSEYRQFIRNYNSSLSFASFCADGMVQSPCRSVYTFQIHGQVHHFTSGAVRPVEGSAPRYNQLYFIDVDAANSVRVQQHSPCQIAILDQLEQMLSEVNPYARIHKTMKDVMAEKDREAERLRRPKRKVILTIKPGIGKDANTYNLPVAANEVAAIFVGDEPPMRNDIRIYPKDRPVQSINNLHPSTDPMTYPLLFPHGEHGYTSSMQHEFIVSELRNKVTCNQFYAYRIMQRQIFSILHHSGKLFQQYLVDAFCKAEALRLWYVKQNQGKLRVETLNEIVQHIQHAPEGGDARVGKVFVLPSSFYGSSRQIYQFYQDSIAIMHHYGKPDLFITFTCNPKWPEIELNLQGRQLSCHRPDLVCRVFKMKLEDFIEDLTKHQILGKVNAYTYTIEFQKRGLPHAHILIILDKPDKILTPEAADATVCAQIPNFDVSPQLHELVKSHMVHVKCGKDASCYREGKCRFNFPKAFRTETLLNYKGFVQYRRPDNGFTVTIGRNQYDNRHIVPYNPYLLLKY
ncbi:uncharacterized protein LOC134527212 isoform X1 [Bacillus rossius redtenbacheri]|uniref:uncharacterized protein LOC134527212 isoform X1 n=1 Tax=Bacillus rossius redtenbacheri TaxID=93214 RepID=UPI002FDC8BDB